MTKVEKYAEKFSGHKLVHPEVFTINQEYTCEIECNLPPDVIKRLRTRELADKFAEVLYEKSETYTTKLPRDQDTFYRGVNRYKTQVVVMSLEEWKRFERVVVQTCISDLLNLIYQDLKKEFEDKIGKKLRKIRAFYNDLLSDKD